MPVRVSLFIDRHGRSRLRWRRTGDKPYYFKSDYPSRGFWDEYDACEEGRERIGQSRIKPGTVDDLMAQYCLVPARLGPSATTQYKVRRILEKDFRDFKGKSGKRVGERMVEDCSFAALDTIIQALAETAPWQAKKLRRHLGKLFTFAKKIGMIDANPVEDTELVAAKSKGYHSWTEAEIDRFVERHKPGTMAHLAMMLMLWTGQRRSDALRMRPDDIVDGYITIEQRKTGTTLLMPVADQLVAAITAMDRNAPPSAPFLLTSYGKPFSDKGFGNWFRARCNEAGLPQCSAHGLRKAASRRAADLGLSNQAIKALTGHKQDREVALYTAGAEQKRLADSAMKALSAWYAGLTKDEG